MRLPCAVTRDLLPLYAEKMVEQETKELIERHLTDCPACRQKLSELNTDTGAPVETVKPLQSLKKQIRKRRWYAAVIAALCVFIAVFTYFYHENDMRLVPWEDGLIEVARVETINSADEDSSDSHYPEASETEPKQTAVPIGDAYTGEALILNVSSFINGFQEHVLVDDDGTTTVIMQAISTNQGSNHQAQGYYELTYYPIPDRLIYGFEQPQKLLWGPPMNGGTEILPRLALSYYLMIAAALAVLCGLVWVIFRKRSYSWILRQLFFAPVSYILSHLLLKGLHAASFFMERDMISILILAMALYTLLSFVWQAFLLRKKEQ